MLTTDTLKKYVRRTAHQLGYTIERRADTCFAPIDVLDLVIHRVASPAPDFFFIQVGANDGISHDPIRQYVTKYHWRGLLIEPLPDVFAALRENYRHEPQLSFENAAVAPTDGEVCFYTAGTSSGENLSGTSSMDREHLRREFGPRVPIRTMTVPALSVPTLLARHAIDRVDLLQIDAEGYDFEIIKLFDLEVIKPTIINFEHVHIPFDRRQVCYRHLVAKGYRLATSVMDTVAYLQDH